MFQKVADGCKKVAKFTKSRKKLETFQKVGKRSKSQKKLEKLIIVEKVNKRTTAEKQGNLNKIYQNLAPMYEKETNSFHSGKINQKIKYVVGNEIEKHIGKM